MKRLLYLALVVTLVSACASSLNDESSDSKGSGITAGQGQDIQFDAVAIGVPSETRIMRSDSSYYRISGNESDVNRISVEVIKGCLTFDVDGWKPMKDKVNIIIKTNGLTGISQSGSGTIQCQSGVLSDRESDLVISGSGRIVAQDLETGLLRGAVSGSGELDLSGKAKSVELSVAGSGDVKAEDLTAYSADIVISGSGTCEIRAENDLNAVITGSGDIIYHGNPKVTTMVSGSGEVTPSK